MKRMQYYQDLESFVVQSQSDNNAFKDFRLIDAIVKGFINTNDMSY